MPSPDKPGAVNYSGFDAYIGLDAMSAYMKGLASRLPVDGRAKLALGRGVARELSRMTSAPADKKLFADNIKWIAALAGQIAREPAKWLVSSFKTPRVQIIAGELVSHLDCNITRESLTSAISSFDERQGLTMDEIWLFPRAVTIELIKAFRQTASRAVEDEREIREAVKWAQGSADMKQIMGRADAFYEKALKVLGERGETAQRKKVEDWLADHMGGNTVARAQQRRSRDDMILSNIVSSLRRVGAIDWKREYEGLCRAEKTLSRDEVYQGSTDNSKAAIRRQVARLSRITGLGEWTIARHAVEMALEANEPPMTTCCWWLYDPDGEASLRHRLMCEGRSQHPSDGARVYMACFFGLFIALAAIITDLAGWWLILPSIVLAWRYAHLALDFIVTRIIKPRTLLKLKFDVVPEKERTLVVVPALLSSVKRATELAAQLEALGAATKDDAIEYLLLGDFKDSQEQFTSEDELIVAAASAAIDAINARDGRGRFHYLHRNRSWAENDRRFMAHERKRGALMALNELLLGKPMRFEAYDADANTLKGRFKYVLTLDADARLLPEAQRALIGAIAHPVNRRRLENGVMKGFSVISPRVEQTAKTRFSKLVSHPGGLDAYPIAASSAYWDMCREALFCGKGIYEIASFQGALKGVVPEGSILSHDLLEGALAGAGLAGDVVVLDDFPSTPSGLLKRLHRWTRGDWQLLPYIFNLPIPPLGRFMMIDNLAGSLAGTMSVVMLVLSMWLGLAVPAIIALAEPIVMLFGSPLKALSYLALLPARAWASADAIARALYRSYRTRQNLLEWTPAADSEGEGDSQRPGKLLAVALLPGLFHGPFAPFTVGLGLVFWAGESWLYTLDEQKPIADHHKKKLFELACATWRYFESIMPVEGNGLAPDNLQIDPPAPPAGRTSPTNIAMYMLACLSAARLGIIGDGEMRARLTATLNSLEQIEKWKGHLYNWYDTETTQPLMPRYVSSVDSGNLAAGLLLISRAVGGVIGDRCEALAREMDLAALYDVERKLFCIGCDITSGRMSESHYDLLASESRILSLVSIALGKVPSEHWQRLGRQLSGKTLISWSGTMFEYLMPELFAKSPAGTLLYESNSALVSSRGGELADAWGVSESGYYAFDSRMNYQYRAFGLADISYRGGGDGRVIAPYATLLALWVDPSASLDNLERMEELGWTGEYGLYEAVDFDPSRVPPGEKYKIVKSFMTHHQGMILMAIADFLTDGSISGAFSGRPDIRAYKPLLEEKPQSARRKVTKTRYQPAKLANMGGSRLASGGFLEGHLLEGGGTTCFTMSNGLALTFRGDICLERFYGGDSANEGTMAYVRCSGVICQWAKARFSPGQASFTGNASGVACRLSVTVSGEDGAVYRVVELENMNKSPCEVEVVNAFAVALEKPSSYASHPAFMNMFVQASMLEPARVAFARKGREDREYPVALCSAAASNGALVSIENDLNRLIGRRGTLSDAVAFSDEFAFTPGWTLNPCLAQKAEIKLSPGEKAILAFTVEFTSPGEAYPKAISVGDLAARAKRWGEYNRARQVAALDFLSIDMARYHEYDQQSYKLLFPRGRAFGEAEAEVTKNDLWALGLDLVNPIIAVFASREDDIITAKHAADRRLFYVSMGVVCDLALVCDEEVGYARPVKDALTHIAQSSSSDASLGSVRLIDGRLMTSASRAALMRCSAIIENERHIPTPAPQAPKFDTPDFEPGDLPLVLDNGFGGFSPDFREYVIRSQPDIPAPWVNVLANENFGAMLTERGGGFCWAGNSRLGRITPWTGDATDEGYMLRIYLERDDRSAISLMPALPAAIARHRQGMSVFESSAGGFKWSIQAQVPHSARFLRVTIHIENVTSQIGRLTAVARCDFLMGADASDERMLRRSFDEGFIFARGAMPGVGYLYMNASRLSDDALAVPIDIPVGQTAAFEVILGYADDENGAREAVATQYPEATQYWDDILSRVNIETPDEALNGFVNRWLIYQTISSRVWARAGFYQAGGAYGFRDQLQDMLLLTTLKPSVARRHIVLCAGRQFESGDVLHWWHPPMTGVRTRISDDCVFLPYVAANYILETGDESILEIGVPYLEDAPIPDNADDVYIAARPSQTTETIHEHCMRAIRRASRRGSHGMALMMGGDWNDGMNRVGGESVWLSEFIAATCTSYAGVLPDKYHSDTVALVEIAASMKKAVDEHGWDGEWYRRAYYPDGEYIGGKDGKVCQIDLVAQSWAVLAGLDREKRQKAMDSAFKRLVGDGVIKLLTPPFSREDERYPGYIADYPPGVRENGGQYTHAACWAVMAWAKLGQPERAWKAFNMLLPYNHALTEKEARRYMVEPYALPADVYTLPGCAGRGGWTWYTGAAGWMHRTALYSLLGYERCSNRVRLNALLPADWDSAGVVVREGASKYSLKSVRGEVGVTLDGNAIEGDWVQLLDDGQEHVAVFPAKNT